MTTILIGLYVGVGLTVWPILARRLIDWAVDDLHPAIAEDYVFPALIGLCGAVIWPAVVAGVALAWLAMNPLRRYLFGDR